MHAPDELTEDLHADDGVRHRLLGADDQRPAVAESAQTTFDDERGRLDACCSDLLSQRVEDRAIDRPSDMQGEEMEGNRRREDF